MCYVETATSDWTAGVAPRCGTSTRTISLQSGMSASLEQAAVWPRWTDLRRHHPQGGQKGPSSRSKAAKSIRLREGCNLV